MSNNIKIMKIVSLLILFSCIISSCNYSVVETIDKTSKQLPNGKHLVVNKINKETTKIGALTNHNYGTSHSFTYAVSIDPGDIEWDGGSGEPKEILFSKDTTYIQYVKKRHITVDSVSRYQVFDIYEKHIDNRYFFKLFGDAYWVEISSEDYLTAKISGDQYLIPNDNELSIKPVTE